MAKKSIVLELSSYSFTDLAAFARIIHDNLDGNPLYPAPVPSLSDFNTSINDLRKRVLNWGVKGNRGSSLDYLQLLDAVDVVQDDLRSLAHYCMATTPGNHLAWGHVGFLTKKPGSKVGVATAPQYVRQVFKENMRSDTVYLRWEKPFGLPKWTRIAYKIKRSSTPDPRQAVEIGTTLKLSFIDNVSAISHVQFYWIVPVNAYGDGVMSLMCRAAAWRNY